MALSLSALQLAHVERQEEWCPDQKPDLSFRGNELGGECGEAQNVIKKLERERHGWRGSRDTVGHLAEELADVIHCAILCAITAGIDLEPAVIAKFNGTSEKNGLATLLPTADGSAPVSGIERAARFVEKRLHDYVSEHGSTDPDTGTVEYPGSGEEYVFDHLRGSMIHEALDLSPRAAAEKSAASSADYYGICWQNTFSDTQDDAYPFWAGQTDAHKVSAIRSAIVTIYAYLHFRSKHDSAIEDERLLFLEEIEPEWRPILARALRISTHDLERRQPRRAFGHDLSIAVNDLFAFANDQETGASLLLEGYRREEIRRLEYKAYCLRNGPLSEQAIQSDEFWSRKNRETFRIAEDKIAIAQEARQAGDATPAKGGVHG